MKGSEKMPYKDPKKRKEAAHKSYLKHRERYRKEAAEEYAKNPEPKKAAARKRYEQKKGEINKARREAHAENPEARRKKDAVWRAKNRDKINQWVKENRDKVNEWKKSHYKKHKKKVNEYNQSKNKGWENAPMRLEPWGDVEDAIIFDTDKTDKEKSELLGRSVFAVRSRRHYLRSEFGNDEIPPNVELH